MKHRKLKDRIAYADTRAQFWLANANIATESGKSAQVIMACERKAQFWLDLLNKLEGYSS